ncbi:MULTISPECIES: acyl carrier protein [Actinokineospora]|uniref:acyl carrier protein n=1 Tax=Actinokineospora TaxID=39845 RepID=UPI000D9BA9F1|nr:MULTISPECIES: acyl carrier protein [Actinokineospora]MCG8916183.1 acyl carrier protein [Actinokineospora sp. PR83]PWW64704.1 phosphopantetheine binding protein [Actinokineospora spheciospongiae]
MASMTWDTEFECVIRCYLPSLDMDAPLDPDLVLSAFGLDSIGMVGLIASLEQMYGVVFPDEALVPANFATPRAAWATVTSLIAADRLAG